MAREREHNKGILRHWQVPTRADPQAEEATGIVHSTCVLDVVAFSYLVPARLHNVVQTPGHSSHHIPSIYKLHQRWVSGL